ncbi:hypothetical protein IFM89_033712 [Coptis chinensis]|uniref:RING-type domain-containing protein n=1 Tax=Coptis chinensis TaxID=261450 RepID=A0A835LFU9_9MAGN|nr:hypothetical protein IFM89_033712 [Coptis chinensis]
MEIAFELQMEEALTDSLLVQPQLAINQNRSTPPIPIDPHTVQLLSQYEREQQDFQNTQRELLKIRNDLKCRVHDQTFARKLLRIPEREWRNYGDNIEKPFNNKGASSSSSSSGDDRTGGVEVFRLYFKGLFRNSGRNGAEIAGIGAAICDPEGNVILNVQKGLIGDWKSDWDVENLQLKVELKALIEGLNAALSLDIKRIDCFCDYHPLYQYITQRWLVHQQRIGTVVDQVCLLQRKFDRSRTFHVARKDVKFAFQLARGAIDSQITRSAESSHARKLKETCNICLEEIDVDQMFAVDGCLHRYCLSCMKQHVEVKLLHGVLPKCPHENCNTQLNIPSCRRFLTPDLIDKMNQHMMEASIPVTDKIYCPYPKCSVLMSKAEVMRYTDKVFVGVDRFATDVVMSFAIPVELNGVTRKQHVAVQSGMKPILSMTDAAED